MAQTEHKSVTEEVGSFLSSVVCLSSVFAEHSLITIFRVCVCMCVCDLTTTHSLYFDLLSCSPSGLGKPALLSLEGLYGFDDAQ